MISFKELSLKNGLRFILAPTRNTRAVTILVLVASGSRYETRKNQGISHFLEHLFFKGSKKRPSALAISQALDSVGAIYNAFTSKEYTGFYIKTADRHQTLAVDVLSDMLVNPLFKKDGVEREKGVILEEIKMYLDTPMAYINSLFERLLYGDTPAGWDIIGTQESVKALTQSQIKNFFKTHYSASNTFVIASGRINLEKTFALLKEAFLSLRKESLPKKAKIKQTQKEPGLLLYPKKTDQTHLCLGVRAYPLGHRWQYEVTVLATLLGSGMSSRLFTKIREEQGLVYYIKTSPEFYTDSGYLVTQVGLDHKNLKKVVKLILEEYHRLKKEKVSSKELNKAKEYLKGVTLLGLETSEAIADFLGKQKVLLGKIETLEEKFKKLDKVSPASLKMVAQKIFQPQKLNLAVISPHAPQKELQKILKV